MLRNDIAHFEALLTARLADCCTSLRQDWQGGFLPVCRKVSFAGCRKPGVRPQIRRRYHIHRRRRARWVAAPRRVSGAVRIGRV
jgi:hypothetical protein